MIKTKVIVLTIIIVTGLVACNNDVPTVEPPDDVPAKTETETPREPEPPAEPPDEPVPLPRSAALANTQWRLVRRVDMDTQIVKSREDILREAGIEEDSGNSFSLAFLSDSSFTGTALAGNFEGVYCLQPMSIFGTLTVTDIRSTGENNRIADSEKWFTDILENRHEYSMSIDEFKLTFNNTYLQFSSDTVPDVSPLREKIAGRWQETARGYDEKMDGESTGQILEFLPDGTFNTYSRNGVSLVRSLYRVHETHLYRDYLFSPQGHIFSCSFTDNDELLLTYEWGPIPARRYYPVIYLYRIKRLGRCR
ncbi:MAG: hypothetical protein LBJ23_04710 [Tannerella sp.]|nr:hypothetical protein [Tannerella sp.]